MVGAVVVGDGTRAVAAVSGGDEVVSLAVPGDAQTSVDPAPVEASEDAGVSPWLVAGIVAAVGVVGASAGVVVGRRTRNTA